MAEREVVPRRRRLTLPPHGLLSESLRSPVTASGGSCFSCLQEECSSDEDDCSSEVPFEAALEALEDHLPEEGDGWSKVMRRGGRSYKDIAQDFWNEIGFPTPTSWFWEKPLSPTVSQIGRASCRERVYVLV